MASLSRLEALLGLERPQSEVMTPLSPPKMKWHFIYGSMESRHLSVLTSSGRRIDLARAPGVENKTEAQLDVAT